VQARSFVAQGAVDEDEVGRVRERGELAGGADADDEGRAAGGELLGDEDRERGSDRAADDADVQATDIGGPHLRVVAGPAGLQAPQAGVDEVADDVTVGVEQADRRDRLVRELLLPARLTEQVLGLEDRRLRICLAAEHGGVTVRPEAHGPNSFRPADRTGRLTGCRSGDSRACSRCRASYILAAPRGPEGGGEGSNGPDRGRILQASATSPESRAPTANPPSRQSR
jgi:hypothetical protein